MKSSNFICFILMSLFFSCTGIRKAQKIKSDIQTEDFKIAINATTSDSINFHYTGCGGFYVHDNNEGILIDPFFSNEGPLSSMLLKKVTPNTKLINSFFAEYFKDGKDSEGTIKATLVSHTHYDHFMDVPYMYFNNLNRDTLKVIGSQNMKKVFKGAENTYQNNANQQNLLAVEKKASTQNKPGEWIHVSERIRVLPIISEHAPHLYFIKLYKHCYKKDLKKLPVKSGKWREGQTFSFLIDFLDSKGNIDFRIFAQPSASNPPLGLPYLEHLQKRKPDIALLCVASFKYVKKYPEDILKEIDPKYVILSHWENFFQEWKSLKDKPMTVPFTNVGKFLDNRFKPKMKELRKESSWVLPNIDTKIKVLY